MIYLFVEGPSDERFFTKIYLPIIGEGRFVRYSHERVQKINDFIHSIDRTPSLDYLFFADSDGKTSEEKKQILLSKYTNLTPEKIIIVHYEIESWYYAGISEEDCKRIKLRNYEFSTDSLTKEQFYSKLSRPSDASYILGRILAVYSLPIAITRNHSLSDFHFNIKKEPANAVY